MKKATLDFWWPEGEDLDSLVGFLAVVGMLMLEHPLPWIVEAMFHLDRVDGRSR